MWTYSACNQASYGETCSDQLLQAEHNGRYPISVQLSQNTYEGRPFLLRHPLCQLPCLFLVHYTRVPRVSLARTPRVARVSHAWKLPLDGTVPHGLIAQMQNCSTKTYHIYTTHCITDHGSLVRRISWLHKTLTSTSVCIEHHPASQCTHKLLHPGMMETCHN